MLGELLLLLGLELLALLQLCIVAQMGRDTGVDVVLLGDIVLDQPRSAVPSFARDRFLDERP